MIFLFSPKIKFSFC